MGTTENLNKSEIPKNFAEFWPFYVQQHLHPINRLLHAIGTGMSFLATLRAPFFSLLGDWRMFYLMINGKMHREVERLSKHENER